MKVIYAVLLVAVLSSPVFAFDTIALPIYTPIVAYEDRITAEKWNSMQEQLSMLNDKITLLQMQVIQIKITFDELKRNSWLNNNTIPCVTNEVKGARR